MKHWTRPPTETLGGLGGLVVGGLVVLRVVVVLVVVLVVVVEVVNVVVVVILLLVVLLGQEAVLQTLLSLLPPWQELPLALLTLTCLPPPPFT